MSVCSSLGTSGTPVAVTGNYIHTVTDRAHWYQYQVDFRPNVDSSKFRRNILKGQTGRMGTRYSFDGMSILFLPIVLPDKVKFDIVFP